MNIKMLMKCYLLLFVTICSMVHVMSQENATVFDLPVIGKPVISPIPNVVVLPGANASLPCLFMGQGNLTAKWMRNETVLTHGNFTENNAINILTLLIPDALSEDDGTYKCVVENEAGITTRSADLYISSKPIIQVANNKIEYTTPQANLTLHCVAAGYPYPTWTWSFNGSRVNETIMKVAPYGNGGTQLHITELLDDLFGDYACKADNPMGTAEHTVNLVKRVRPLKPAFDCSANKNSIKCVDNNEKGKILHADSPSNYLLFAVEASNVDEKCCKPGSNVTLKDCEVPVEVISNSEGDVWLYNRKPNTQYYVQAAGSNEAGESEFGECVVVSIEAVEETSSSNLVVWLVIVGVILAIVIIDLICCLASGRGLTACIHRRFTRHPRKEHRIRITDLESYRSDSQVVLLKSTQRNI